MKVLHVIESGGGTVEFIYLLGKKSPEIIHHVLCGKRAYEDFNFKKEEFLTAFPANIHLFFWPYVNREISLVQDVKAFWFLYNFLNSSKIVFDVIHLHSSKAGLLGRIAAYFTGFKNVIYTTHAVSFIRTDISTIKRNFYILIERIGGWFGGTTVCNSESEMHVFILHKLRAICIPNGTEIVDFESSNFEKNIITIVNVGRITLQKDPFTFNEIAKAFISNNSVKFIWVGDGELRHLMTSKNVEIAGWRSRSEVNSFLINSDIYLSTSLWEGMPIAVLEAMSYGKPLVLSNSIGNLDLVKQDENGFTYSSISEAISYIEQLYNDNIKRYSFGKKSHEIFLQKYTLDTMCKNYFIEYFRII